MDTTKNLKQIEIKCEEDIDVLFYFVSKADKLQYKVELTPLEIIEGQRALEIIPKIKEVNGKCGYVVLEDDTIRCTDFCSSAIYAYDGCTEREMFNDLWSLIKGY